MCQTEPVEVGLDNNNGDLRFDWLNATRFLEMPLWQFFRWQALMNRLSNCF